MPGASPRPLIPLHASWYCGFNDGEPIADDETEAPDSDEVERLGG